MIRSTNIIMIESGPTSGITLRQEETVLEILKEVGSLRHIELDQELERLIQKGQEEIEAEYQAQAEQRMVQHRQGINFDEIKENIQIEIKEQITHQPALPQQNQLQLFQLETLKKTKRTQMEIMELDREFPKLNYSGMIGKQQSIFGLKTPQAAKWTSFQKTNVQTAVMAVIGQNRWIIMGIEKQLIIFKGQNERQPTILSLNGKIGTIAVSPCKRYVGVGVKTQINIYQIRKKSNMVLLKNFPDLKIGTVTFLTFYEGEGPRICFVDQKGLTGVIALQIGMILTKVRIDEVMHKLPRVNSCDALRVKPKTALLAVGGPECFQLIKIQPQLEYYQRMDTTGRSLCSWRRHNDKISLIVGAGNKMTIYKLVHDAEEDLYFLQQHLLLLNHYPIQSMFKLTPYHYLLQSEANFVVVALPLISSVLDDPDLAMSETALVFSFERQQQNKVVFGMQEGLLLVWKGLLQFGTYRSLEEQIDNLILQKVAFRQAFSLLVLIYRGMNYSFRFSYNSEDLRRLVHSAVQVAATALMPSLDERTVLFRVGWMVQLCIECGQQDWMWSYLYPTLKQRKIEIHLFNMIQIFILKGQLTSIPQTIFLQIITYYSSKGKQVIIQKLVLCNRQQFEASLLLSLLNHRQMNYLQFYLFSKAILSDQHDFYTPFIRAYSAFVKNLDHQKEKTVQSGLLCYWILNKSFKFEHVPSGQMTRDTKIQVATQFFLQTLSKTFARKLSDYNPKLYLECYLVPFLNHQFRDILSQEQTQIMSSFREFDSSGQIVHETEFVNAFLNYLQSTSGGLRNNALFAQFYATVLYLTHSQAKFQRIVDLLATLFQKKFYTYQLRITIGMRPPVSELKVFLLEMISPQLRSRPDRLYIKKLLTFEDREVGYLLHLIDKNYQTALEIYLSNYRTDGLFQLMTTISDQIQSIPTDPNYTRQRKHMELRTFIIKNIGMLFRSDGDAALQICYLIGETTQKIHDLVFKNPFQNNQRIFFLTAVLNKWTNQQFQFKEQYLLQHLQEVCSLPQRDMRNYLNKFYYPLDSAIKVADRKSNYLAKAILQQRSGLVQQAFASYQKLIQSTLTTNRQEQQTRNKVGCYIEECVAICKHYSGEVLEENLWVRLIKFLSNFVASQQKYKIHLKVQLQRSTQNIINEMLMFLSTKLLINFFTAPQIPLPLYKLMPIFGQLFRMIKFDGSTIQRSMLIVKLDIINIRRGITFQSRFGMSVNCVCDFCRGRLEEEHEALGFSCRHAFHKLCHGDTSVCLTCSYQSDDFLFNKAIFKKVQLKAQPQKPSKQKQKIDMNKDIYVQSKSQALLQSRKKKLKVYDFETSNKDRDVFALINPMFRVGELELYQK